MYYANYNMTAVAARMFMSSQLYQSTRICTTPTLMRSCCLSMSHSMKKTLSLRFQSTKISINDDSIDAIRERKKNHENDTKHQVLDAALTYVNELGWTIEAIAKGCQHAGYPPTMHGLFPRGGSELIEHHIHSSNERLSLELGNGGSSASAMKLMDSKQKLCFAVETRLRYNLPFIKRWPEAVAVLAQPPNIPYALEGMALLVDELWVLAEDSSTGPAWYTRRALLSGLYAATEAFMVQDTSENYEASWAFLSRRLNELYALDGAEESVKEATSKIANLVWAVFQTSKNLTGSQSRRT